MSQDSFVISLRGLRCQSDAVGDVLKAWELALPNGKVTFAMSKHLSQERKGNFFFCQRRHFRFLLTSPEFWFAFNNACWHFNYPMWALQDRSTEEERSKETSRG